MVHADRADWADRATETAATLTSNTFRPTEVSRAGGEHDRTPPRKGTDHDDDHGDNEEEEENLEGSELRHTQTLPARETN